jgi:general secretion pathway protein G
MDGQCKAAGPKAKGSTSEPRALFFAPRPSKGFSFLELVIVIAIIAILTALFMNRALFYQEQAEKAAMEQVAGAIQSALIMQYGLILTRGKPSDVAILARDNPINWLQKKPHNYAGEFYAPTPQSAEPGNWLFDLKTRNLVYLVRKAEHFKPGREGNNWIRFHVATRYAEPGLTLPQNAAPELTGIVFEPVETYSWF